MTTIDFYVLETEAASELRFGAKLAQDSFRQRKAVHIFHQTAATLADISEQLWSFSQSSFIANGAATSNPVTLGSADDEPSSHQNLIVLGGKIPPFFSRFEHLSVVVANDETKKAIGREQYAFFKKRGYPLHFKPVKHANF